MLLVFSCTQSPKQTKVPEQTKAPEQKKNLEQVFSEIKGNPIYDVILYDSSSGSAEEVKYEFADFEKYNDIQPSEEIVILINGKEYVGSYKQTDFVGYNYFPTYEYSSSNGIEFSIDESNKLTSCYFGRSDKEGELSEEACKQIATDFMDDIIDLSQYRVSVTADNEQKYYTVEFNKYINDIKTTDSATVVVLYNGDIYRYYSHMLGRVLTENSLDNIDINDVKASVYERLEKRYANKKYDYIEHKTDTIMITKLKDESVGFVVFTAFTFFNKYGEYALATGDKCCFVVEVN